MAAKDAYQKATQKIERVKSKQEALLAGINFFLNQFLQLTVI